MLVLSAERARLMIKSRKSKFGRAAKLSSERHNKSVLNWWIYENRQFRNFFMIQQSWSRIEQYMSIMSAYTCGDSFFHHSGSAFFAS